MKGGPERRAFLSAVATAAVGGFASTVFAAAPTASGFPARGAQALSGASILANGVEWIMPDVLAPAILSLYGEAEPFALDARNILQEALDAGVTLTRVLAEDRWGRRIAAFAMRSDGRDLAQRLVLNGAVRVNPKTEDLAAIRDLLAAEAEARRRSRGLWAIPRYRIRRAVPGDAPVGAFHVIEGRVVRAASKGARVYFNFGSDYRKDVTASVRRRTARAFAEASAVDLSHSETGDDWERFAGASIRVRGYVAWINGPSIDVSHPLQLEWRRRK